MEVEFFFGFFWKCFFFFEFIFKEFEKKIGKFKKKYFIILKVLKGKIKLFWRVLKEIKKWFIKSSLFIKKMKKEFLKVNLIVLFRFKEIDELNEMKKEKDFLISN